MTNVDNRYNNPKAEPKADPKVVQDTINTNDIYSEAKQHILNAQARQVAYGLDKYPEPLNKNSWSTIETIDHIIEESVDKLHYLVMLKLKLIKELEETDKKEEELNQLYLNDLKKALIDRNLNTIVKMESILKERGVDYTHVFLEVLEKEISEAANRKIEDVIDDMSKRRPKKNVNYAKMQNVRPYSISKPLSQDIVATFAGVDLDGDSASHIIMDEECVDEHITKQKDDGLDAALYAADALLKHLENQKPKFIDCYPWGSDMES